MISIERIYWSEVNSEFTSDLSGIILFYISGLVSNRLFLWWRFRHLHKMSKPHMGSWCNALEYTLQHCGFSVTSIITMMLQISNLCTIILLILVLKLLSKVLFGWSQPVFVLILIKFWLQLNILMMFLVINSLISCLLRT